jgi:hypothetical protein
MILKFPLFVQVKVWRVKAGTPSRIMKKLDFRSQAVILIAWGRDAAFCWLRWWSPQRAGSPGLRCGHSHQHPPLLAAPKL